MKNIRNKLEVGFAEKRMKREGEVRGRIRFEPSEEKGG